MSVVFDFSCFQVHLYHKSCFQVHTDIPLIFISSSFENICIAALFLFTEAYWAMDASCSC